MDKTLLVHRAKPMASEAISYMVPDLPRADELLPYLRRIDETRCYSNCGPLVRELESQLCSVVAARHHLAHGDVSLTTLSSGYDALLAALRHLCQRRPARVLIPAITFPACGHAVENAGLELLLGDVDESTWAMTPTIARTIAARVNIAVVMPVAVYGAPVSARDWDAFAAETGISVLVDAAAAFEVQAPLKHGLVAHSFHATKPLGIGEGGSVIGCDSDLIERIRIYTNFGLQNRLTVHDGTNAKMSEYHAAVGLAQLARWDQIKRRRKAIFELYRSHFASLAELVSFHPLIDDTVISLLMIRCKTCTNMASRLAKVVRRSASFHRTYLPPLYRHPRFARVPIVDAEGKLLTADAPLEEKLRHMSNSEQLTRELLGIPFHPFLTDHDVMSIKETVISMLLA